MLGEGLVTTSPVAYVLVFGAGAVVVVFGGGFPWFLGAGKLFGTIAAPVLIIVATTAAVTANGTAVRLGCSIRFTTSAGYTFIVFLIFSI